MATSFTRTGNRSFSALKISEQQVSQAEEFFLAIQEGNARKLRRLLTEDSMLIYARDELGRSPILAAAYADQPEIANTLADLTVLLSIFEAVAIGKIPHIVRLLAKDPDVVNAFSEEGMTPLVLAAWFGHEDVVEFLLQAGARVNSATKNNLKMMPLHAATLNGHAGAARILLAHGADANAAQQGGVTPLHIAARNGDVPLLRLLLFNGADLKRKTDDGLTPLDIALAEGYDDAAELLRMEITKRFRRIHTISISKKKE